METKNLQLALGILGQLSPDLTNKGDKVLVYAQQELAELQRLVSVVQGFVEEHGLNDDSKVQNMAYNKPNVATMFIVELCEIVGYKES